MGIFIVLSFFFGAGFFLFGFFSFRYFMPLFFNTDSKMYLLGTILENFFANLQRRH